MRAALTLLVVGLLAARWLLRRRRPPAAPNLGDAFDRYADGGDRA